MESRILLGDCLDVLPTLPAGSADACITDPPYGIGAAGCLDWDRLPPRDAWAALIRVLAPSAPLAVLTARRHYHRVAGMMESAGCRIHDMGVWLYATGRASGRQRLRAAHDPIVLATSGPGPMRLDVEAGRIPVAGHDGPGRWPTTVAHDGSATVTGSLPRVGASRRRAAPRRSRGAPGPLERRGWDERLGDLPAYGEPTGSAARYFYCAPAAPGRRRHPTEKPVALMRWLIRMMVPPGGVVLDPWAGGGTTCVAAVAEGRGCIGIERDAAYVALARAAGAAR